MKPDPIQTRTIALEGKPEGRRMAAALSSELPVPRLFGNEILEHSLDAVDMTRAANGLPLLLNHDREGLPIGRVDGIHIGNDQRLRGQLTFSDATQEARDAYALAEEGTLSDVSISYRIMEWERGAADDDVVVTRWMPLEASLVSVPADHQAGIGRSHSPTEELPMAEKETPVAGEATTSIIEKVEEKTAAGNIAGARAENARLVAIRETSRQLARALPHLSDQIEALEREVENKPEISADQHRAFALEMAGGAGFPAGAESQSLSGDYIPAERGVELPGGTHRGIVTQGRDAADKAAEGMALSLYERCGGKVDAAEAKGNQFRGWSLIDIADTCLRYRNIDTRGMSREQIAKQAIAISNRYIEAGAATGGASSDYSAVTSNVASRFMFAGFEEAEVTWDQWCATSSTSDFKTFEVPRLSAFGSLPVVAENGQYLGQQMVDARESGALVKHGATLALTWEATVNDDLGFFQRNAFRMGEAAARTLDEQVYALLVANQGAGPVGGPVMGDTNQLFDSTNHNNTGTDALDLAGIVATRTAMARQTDENSVLLGVELRYVLVPIELYDQANNLSQSEYLPWPEGAPAAQRVNTVRNTFEVVATARLTDATDWFGLARRGQTFEVVFLNGQQAPTLEQEMGWSYDTLNWKVRHVFDILPVDWRGMFWNQVAG